MACVDLQRAAYLFLFLSVASAEHDLFARRKCNVLSDELSKTIEPLKPSFASLGKPNDLYNQIKGSAAKLKIDRDEAHLLLDAAFERGKKTDSKKFEEDQGQGAEVVVTVSFHDGDNKLTARLQPHRNEECLLQKSPTQKEWVKKDECVKEFEKEDTWRWNGWLKWKWTRTNVDPIYKYDVKFGCTDKMTSKKRSETLEQILDFEEEKKALVSVKVAFTGNDNPFCIIVTTDSATAAQTLVDKFREDALFAGGPSPPFARKRQESDAIGVQTYPPPDVVRFSLAIGLIGVYNPSPLRFIARAIHAANAHSDNKTNFDVRLKSILKSTGIDPCNAEMFETMATTWNYFTAGRRKKNGDPVQYEWWKNLASKKVKKDKLWKKTYRVLSRSIFSLFWDPRKAADQAEIWVRPIRLHKKENEFMILDMKLEGSQTYKTLKLPRARVYLGTVFRIQVVPNIADQPPETVVIMKLSMSEGSCKESERDFQLTPIDDNGGPVDGEEPLCVATRKVKHHNRHTKSKDETVVDDSQWGTGEPKPMELVMDKVWLIFLVLTLAGVCVVCCVAHAIFSHVEENGGVKIEINGGTAGIVGNLSTLSFSTMSATNSHNKFEAFCIEDMPNR